MPEGTVKFFNRAKGFGFIVPDDGDKEIFLPPAAVTGIAALSPGQRVSFEVVADPKGPKAASLKILGSVAPKPQMAPRPQAVTAPPPVGVSLYCEPATQAAQDVLAALQAQNQHAQIVDITVTPLTVPQLRKWSQALAGTGQGLVRRSMPLFFDLQLDDRFLHEDEFWTAVAQHPALLTGPILSVRDRVRVCRTPEDVKAFFAAAQRDIASKAKDISPRLMAMMRGEAVAPRPPAPVSEPPARAKVAPEPKPAKKAAPAPAEAAKPKAAAKPVKAKTAPKAVKPAAKKAVAKPAVKKAVKAAKPVKKKAR